MAKINDPDWAWRARGNTHRKLKAKKGKKHRPHRPKTSGVYYVFPNGVGNHAYWDAADYTPGALAEWKSNELTSNQKDIISAKILGITYDTDPGMYENAFHRVDFVAPIPAAQCSKISVQWHYDYYQFTQEMGLYVADYNNTGQWDLWASHLHTDGGEDYGIKSISGNIIVDFANYYSGNIFTVMVTGIAPYFEVRTDRIMAVFEK